ncbi:MAG: hypothetical protein ING90_08630 [Rhodocyclaceae bacterium]|nr:hypothetical protein [Rhodocyclaceae bacterium]MCA3074183.1 hypothetical protein [Rhodocyclaceae bacterium]MCA3095096.1 hypothetical protein [Rhodocyclaceae bacterium]MCA3097172.1 hypothetical protein [Rhodocyclaceae bacterium]MCA3102826.1 hypothetical protein [Rhodocyclaceae bacterium]
MLDTLIATRFDRRITKGRTRPFLLECENRVGRSVAVVAKFTSAQLAVEGLVREAFGAMLAADLGLPVPECFCVTLSPEFVAAVSTMYSADGAALAAAVPIGFGSTMLPNGFAAWMPERRVPMSMQQAAAEIYAFDLLIQNPDRRPENPNLQVKGERFAIFDHELAFVTEGVLFWAPPWTPGALNATGSVGTHLLFPSLRGTRPDLTRLATAWEAIDDERLTAYRASLPPQWTASTQAAHTADTVIDFLHDLRQHIGPAMREILRTLS